MLGQSILEESFKKPKVVIDLESRHLMQLKRKIDIGLLMRAILDNNLQNNLELVFQNRLRHIIQISRLLGVLSILRQFINKEADDTLITHQPPRLSTAQNPYQSGPPKNSVLSDESAGFPAITRITLHQTLTEVLPGHPLSKRVTFVHLQSFQQKIQILVSLNIISQQIDHFTTTLLINNSLKRWFLTKVMRRQLMQAPLDFQTDFHDRIYRVRIVSRILFIRNHFRE